VNGAKTGAEIVIPPKRNRKVKRAYDTELHKERDIPPARDAI